MSRAFAKLKSARSVRALAVLALSACLCSVSLAHEVRPAFLDLKEEAPGSFDVLFKTPMVGDLRLSLGVSFSGPVQALTPVTSRTTGDALIQTWRIRASGGLAGRDVRIVGLENTISDALLRVEFADGRSWDQRLTPAAPAATVPTAQSGSGVAAAYFTLGVEHILLGYDHLLFVLGLYLLASTLRQLAGAITAFTAAHSFTLAAAALGLVRIPSKPVEAIIALSIAFLAVEIVRARSGTPGIAVRAPWIVAFAFGLLHGLGFAGALSEIGIPSGHIPVALFFFNVGVEAGQLLFVAAVMALAAAVRFARLPLPPWATLVPPYLIGSLATAWFAQRVFAF